MKGQTALITGASRGIGREVARSLVADGWRVLAGVRDPSSAPPGTEAEVMDVSDPMSIDALAGRLRDRETALDALVNNAGIYRGPARDIWRVNVLGPLRLTRALLSMLNDRARIVMVTSGLGKRASQSTALVQRLDDPALSYDAFDALAEEAPGGYGGSKAALNAMTRLFARDLRDRGILVNAASPGWARTDMGGAHAPRSVRQGADSVLWAVRIPDSGPTGGVFEDGKRID